jgi:hypothetical protein
VNPSAGSEGATRRYCSTTFKSFPVLFLCFRKTPDLIPLVPGYFERFGRSIYDLKPFLNKLIIYSANLRQAYCFCIIFRLRGHYLTDLCSFPKKN